MPQYSAERLDVSRYTGNTTWDTITSVHMLVRQCEISHRERVIAQEEGNDNGEVRSAPVLPASSDDCGGVEGWRLRKGNEGYIYQKRTALIKMSKRNADILVNSANLYRIWLCIMYCSSSQTLLS